jgi:3-oxoadipate enol-lactonase
MPFAEISGGRVHYRFDGDADAPVLLLSSSLGADLTMWDKQAAPLSRSFRILRYDSRGHNRSLVTPGPCTIEQLALDVVSLLDRLEVSRATVAGRHDRHLARRSRTGASGQAGSRQHRGATGPA